VASRDTKGKRPAEEPVSAPPPTTNSTGVNVGLKRHKTQDSRAPESESLDSMNKIQLISLCKAHNLSTSGNKEALVTRLKEAGLK